MSGGKDRRSRSSKTQGWEEAGGEFYQESYPADLEGMQRDPSKIATLLPSKQTRNATTRRVRPSQQDTKGTRRRASFSTVARRGSQYHEIQVATLPDLSENLINEERTWEEIQEIKSMPVPMAQKREMKAQLQNATKLRLQGFEQIKWRRRKAWQSIRSKWGEYRTKLELWRMSLKTIEGNFGTGVVAYFLFLRWLMFLNLIVFGLISTFIVLPHLALREPRDVPCELGVNSTSVQCCSESYVNVTKAATFSVLDVIQGTGFMEGTLLFYGMYTNMIYGYSPLEDRLIGRAMMTTTTTTEIPTTMSSTTTTMSSTTTISSSSISSVSISSSSSTTEALTTTVTAATTPAVVEAVIAEIKSGGGNFSSLNGSFFESFVMELEQASDDQSVGSRSGTVLYYDFPLVYVIITAICYVIALVAIMKAVVRQFKDRIAEGEGLFYQYCNLVFGGWDFCIHNEKSADVKHKALYHEIRSLLHTKRFENERSNRSRDFMVKLIAIRFVINFVVVIILLLAVVIIYLLFSLSMSALEPNYIPSYGEYIKQAHNWTSWPFSSSSSTTSTTSSPSVAASSEDTFSARSAPDTIDTITLETRLMILFYEFLPYLAIVIMNLVVPLLFNYLVQFEKYSPLFVIKISLFRTVFLRLSSLAVLLSRFYFLVQPKSHHEHQLTNTTEPFNATEPIPTTDQCYDAGTGKPQCWETFVGQQFYKLFIVDFATHFLVTFFVNFPRAMFARHSSSRVAKFIGEQEFELSKHVLDVIYSQTLCWLGTFYTPFLPAIAAILFFFMFYIKKFACLVNSNPSAILYRASRSNSLFMSTLLISFTLAIIPVVYAWAEIIPSRSCGPFRGLPFVWDRAITAFMKTPAFFQTVIFFFGTASFAVPCFVILTFFIYYYYAVSAANRHMVSVLKHQLVLEGHDKQFLLSRLSLFIKQQQEYQKRMMRQAAEQQQHFQQGNNIGHDLPPPPQHLNTPPVAPPKPPKPEPELQPPLPPRADRDSKPSSRDRERKEGGEGK